MIALTVGLIVMVIYSIYKTRKVANSMKEENFKMKINKKSSVKNILAINIQNTDASSMFIGSIACYICLIYIVSALVDYGPHVRESRAQLLQITFVTLSLLIVSFSSVIRNTYKGLAELGIKEDEIILYGETYKIENFRSYKWNRDRLFIELERNFNSIASVNSGTNIQYELFIPIDRKAQLEEILSEISSATTA